MKQRLCPHCRKSNSSEDKKIWPFCTERCKINDLGNWASESYRIPVEGSDSSDLEIPETDSENEELN